MASLHSYLIRSVAYNAFVSDVCIYPIPLLLADLRDVYAFDLANRSRTRQGLLADDLADTKPLLSYIFEM